MESNLRGIPRQASISHQGSPRHGYYDSDLNSSPFDCYPVKLRYSVTSPICGDHVTDTELSPGETVSFSEGEFCFDAVLRVQAASIDSGWSPVYGANIENMIDSTLDVYFRGTDLGNGEGVFYASYEYDTFSLDCDKVPEKGAIPRSIKSW